jgi:disulfide bond formation protein DsbB
MLGAIPLGAEPDFVCPLCSRQRLPFVGIVVPMLVPMLFPMPQPAT